MPPRLTSAGRGTLLAVLLAGAAASGLGACGRRGQPEPPGQTSDRPATTRAGVAASAAGPSPTSETRPQTGVVNAPDDDEDNDQADRVSPQPTPGPTSRRRRPYEVPKQPFILDPLL